MTGGTVVILGPFGYNLGAGMTGGLAYLLDPDPVRVNADMADLEGLDDDDATRLGGLIGKHLTETGSDVAARLLASSGCGTDPVRQGHAQGLQAGTRRGPAGRA